MSGFGTINPRNINEIVVSIEKQIKEIKSDFTKDVTVLSNKLEKCEYDLKQLKEYIEEVHDYTETEYTRLQDQIHGFEDDIEYLKNNLNQVEYIENQHGKVAVGIAPLSEYSSTSSTYPIFAKYADGDSNGNIIAQTYATKTELSSVSSTLSADYIQKISESSSAGMSALSSISGELSNAISEECQRATSAEQEIGDRIDEEVEQRRIIDDLLEDSIEAETSARIQAIDELQNSLLYEETARKNADETLQQIIDDETTRAADKENELDTRIDTLSGYVDTQVENIYTNVSSVSSILNEYIEEETNRAVSTEDALNTAIDNEISRATNVETSLDNKIDSLSSSIGNEISRAEREEQELYNYINKFADITEENLAELENTISSVSSTLNDSIVDEYTRASTEESRIAGLLGDEITNRINADNHLQSQIDTIEATQNVVDIVGTKAELDAYDTTKLKENDKIQVLKDETQSDATSIYNWIGTDFSIVGTLGQYYTKSEVDSISSNLSTLISDEERRAIDAEYNLDNKIDSVSSSITIQLNTTSGTLFNNLNISATGLSNTITSLSGTVDDNIESLSSNIDRQFEDSYSYIEELSGTAQSQYDVLNDGIEDLYDTKQDNLSAGDGIDITNDVVSHSIKVIENNGQEDTIEDTVMTVYLKNNHYKVITLDPTVTEIQFWVTKTANNVLQETGFEFQVPENSVLESLEFSVIGDENKKIYTIIPDSYSSPNIYQGTIVNYRCTIGEYEVED